MKKTKRTVTHSSALLLLLLCATLSAAPQLRLSQTIVGGNTTIEARNSGDGSLSLTATVSASAGWVTVSVGAPRTCVIYQGDGCIPIQFTINTSGLANGLHTAEVTISDPNAIDAPQVIDVEAQVGPRPPVVVDQWIAPGETRDMMVYSASCTGQSPCATGSVTTQDGGMWLSLNYSRSGTAFHVDSFAVHLAPPADMAPGTYTGSVSGLGAAIPVTMRVTAGPIAVPSTTAINLSLASGGPAVTNPFLPAISVANSGIGTLVVQGASAAGSGVSASTYGNFVIVAIDPSALAPGAYTGGSVTIQCNAANCPLQIPISFNVLPPSLPVIQYSGVTDNATFNSFYGLALGDVAIVKGTQLSASAPAFAASVPLPVKLGGARVLVDGTAAPLYYSSAGQIAFQVPSSLAVGQHLVQVERDGAVGNTVSVQVVASLPEILKVTDTSYNVRDVNHPAHRGETLVIWAIGLGQTNPPVADGMAAPLNPLAVVVPTPGLQLGGVPITPLFAGLSPGGVGLFQINFTVPDSTPTGHPSILSIRLNEFFGLPAMIAVE